MTDKTDSLSSKELLFRMQTVAALVKNDEIKAALSDGIAEIARLTKECAELKSDAAYFRENRDLVGAEVERLRAALLQHDGWLANTGHFADHPWRLHIARTLEGSARETKPNLNAECLSCGQFYDAIKGHACSPSKASARPIPPGRMCHTHGNWNCSECCPPSDEQP